MPNIGDPAPDFTLPDQHKNPVSLSEYAGRKLVIAFFPAAFTGICEKEMCTFRDQLANFNDLGADIVGISVDSPMTLNAFESMNELEFPLLSDYTRTVVHDYGVAMENFAGLEGYTAAERSVFIVEANGTISYRWVAPNPGVEPNYDEVRAALT